MRDVILQLRQRHVLKVGAVYAVAAVAAVEAADIVFPRLLLPDWSVTLVLAMAIVGFPLALALSWAYEVTPEGIRRDRGEATAVEPRAAEPPVPVAAPARPEAAAATAPVPAAPDRPASIAVLPFADLSVAKDQEYLADGLAEEILNSLARLRHLRVAARTSSFAYKGRQVDIRELGRQLTVAHVLEGSVRKWGDRVRVTAQLISVDDGYHLWSETYDRQLDDMFAIQDDIARSIVEKLQVELLEEEREGSIVAEHTSDPEAYDLYLKGRHAWYNRYRVGLQTALTYFEQARERDPDFALAHCGVADTYSILGLYGLMPPLEARRRSREAVDRALALAPDLAEAVFSDAFHFALIAPAIDWDSGYAGFQRACHIRPDYAEALAWHGIVVATRAVAPAEEVFDIVKRARAMDPDSAYVADLAGLACLWIGHPGRALPHLAFALRHNPEDTIALYGAGVSHLTLGRHDEALEHLRRAAELTNRASTFLGILGFALARAGETGEARGILDELLERERTGYVLPAVIAGVAASLGEESLALDYLEEAARMECHPAPTWWIRFDIWDAVSDHPRYRAVLERLEMAPNPPVCREGAPADELTGR